MKYKNIKTQITFQNKLYQFDSKAEAECFNGLVLLLKQGKISDLTLQPTYRLTEGFKINTTATKSGKSKIQGMKYTPDFEYIRDGEKIAVEVKGKITKDYVMRKKLFLVKAKDFGIDVFIEKFAKNEIAYDCKTIEILC